MWEDVDATEELGDDTIESSDEVLEVLIEMDEVWAEAESA